MKIVTQLRGPAVEAKNPMASGEVDSLNQRLGGMPMTANTHGHPNMMSSMQGIVDDQGSIPLTQSQAPQMG